MDELLRVRGLKLQFRSMRGVVKALDGVDISVHEREILGLVGESGCGKTITGLAILGLLQKPQAEITGGEISYRGQDLLAKSDKEMQDLRGREISMVFQDPLASLNPVFQVGHQIEDVVRIHKGVSKKESRETARRALAEVGLPATDETLKRYPHQFSGGMRQRVCMAMALACGSPLLIADEPTTALDVTIQAQILNLLLRLREELGVAQVIITHNVGVAAQTCDRIAVMYAGSVVEEGPVVEVLSRPRHPYTIALYQCLPHGHTASELQTIPGTVPDLIDSAHRLSLPSALQARARRVPHRQAAARAGGRPPLGLLLLGDRPGRRGARQRGGVVSLLRGRRPHGPLPHPPRPGQEVDRHRARRGRRLVRDHRGRDAGAGGRIGVRQVHGRPRRPPAGQADRGHHPVPRPGPLRPRHAPAPQGDARRPGGVPGPLLVAEPAHDRPRPGRRAAPGAVALERPGAGGARPLPAGDGRPGDAAPVAPLARVQRRPVPAHRHRAGPGAGPQARRARRADLRARRLRPGAHPRAARRPPAAPRPHLSVHRPRPRRRRVHGALTRGDVPRAHRRAGPRRGDLRAPLVTPTPSPC